MAAFRPGAFTAPIVLLIPTYSKSSGVEKKTFPTPENGVRMNGSFKSYGGTDRDVNGVYSVEDTAIIETWFDPRVRSECHVYIPGTGGTYEILGAPENIGLRNQFIRMKVRRIEGGV